RRDVRSNSPRPFANSTRAQAAARAVDDQVLAGGLAAASTRPHGERRGTPADARSRDCRRSRIRSGRAGARACRAFVYRGYVIRAAPRVSRRGVVLTAWHGLFRDAAVLVPLGAAIAASSSRCREAPGDGTARE